MPGMNLKYLWDDPEVKMKASACIQNNILVLKVVPDEGDEDYVLNVELKQGWLWEEMFALSEWQAFKKSV
uniref:Uncharacterized protein n=1 Tax=viral metagenome TaxID=1070528 RepID=A0A6C0E0F2_9ZZZZ